MSIAIETQLNKAQLELIESPDRHLAFCGGFSSGKTYGVATKALTLAIQNRGFDGAIIGLNYSLTILTLCKAFEDILDYNGIKWHLQKSHPRVYFLDLGGDKLTEIYVLTLGNYNFMRGYNLAWAILDEFDVLKKNVAQTVWELVLGRVRLGNFLQICVASTPEGRSSSFMYQTFANTDTKIPNSKIIKCATYDNPRVDVNYVLSMLDNYPPHLIKAYLLGEFVELTADLVYPYFSQKNIVDIKARENIPLYVGVDFNVNGMNAIAAQKNPTTNKMVVVDEIVNERDTQILGRKIVNKYQKWQDRGLLFLHPDASGNSKSSQDSKITNFTILEGLGLKISLRYKKNPYVIDRVNTVNAAFHNAQNVRSLFINKDCKHVIECLESQGYDKGKPEKDGIVDGAIDALGYIACNHFPLATPTLRKTGLISRVNK
jgi:hypothetical protein